MPLLMTVPITVGETDTADYTHLKIVSFSMDLESGSFSVRLVPGYLINGVFTTGIARDTKALPTVNGFFTLSGAAFQQFMQQHGATYTAVRNGLYQWVIDNIRAGTIVD